MRACNVRKCIIYHIYIYLYLIYILRSIRHA